MPSASDAVGRNEPCPCGSGKKYKKCCMGKGVSFDFRGEPTPPSTADLLRQAFAAHQKGQLPKARALYTQALGLNPKDFDALHGLAALEFHSMQIHEALAYAERALAVYDGNAMAHCLLAKCHLRLNDPDMAAAASERAVKLAPDDHDVLLTAARVESGLGNHEAAQVEFSRLTSDGVPIEFRHQALTDLGFALDKLGDYEAAYDAFRRAGETWMRVPAVQSVDGGIARQRVRTYRDRLTPELLGRFKAEPFDDLDGKPAFLVGFPRSGTTMTEQVLAAHPDVVTSDEEQLIAVAGKRLMAGAAPGAKVPDALECLDRERVLDLRHQYWQRAKEVMQPTSPGQVLVDKMPMNIIEIGLINVIFPDALAIVALRDPRDVCLSCFMQGFAPNPAMVNLYSLESAVDFYVEVMGFWRHLREMLTMPYIEVRYEDTVSDLETQARRVIDVLDLPWDDDVLSFHEKARQRFIRTPSFAAVTEKVHTRAIGRWRNYEKHFEPLMGKLEPFVEVFGYGQE